MSQDNVKVVRAMVDAFDRGDFETCLAALDEDVSWQDPPDMPGGGLNHGRDEVARSFVRWLPAWENFRGEIEELLDAGDDVVAVTRMRGRGRASGIEVDLKSAQVYEVRDGKIVKVRQFRERADALAAVGLR